MHFIKLKPFLLDSYLDMLITQQLLVFTIRDCQQVCDSPFGEIINMDELDTNDGWLENIIMYF